MFVKKLLKSFSWAVRGILLTAETQRNMQIHFAVTLAVVLAGFFFHIARHEWVLLILTICVVLSGELFNTAVEKAVDLISPDYHPLAGQAKDIAAGAVFLSVIGAVMVGLLIFGPYLWAWFQPYINIL